MISQNSLNTGYLNRILDNEKCPFFRSQSIFKQMWTFLIINYQIRSIIHVLKGVEATCMGKNMWNKSFSNSSVSIYICFMVLPIISGVHYPALYVSEPNVTVTVQSIDLYHCSWAHYTEVYLE